MSDYAIYLRKSRVDMEAEAHGQGDTLQRHRVHLLALAEQRGLAVVKIYEEVVSGDTITSRPQMQQLLHDVESNLYAGVLVMEIERLARGDTIDQGMVARAFQFSGTKIITPLKTYDPQNEFDQEYFEFGLYMSRREYKTINRRQQAGRIASLNEGKWVANKAPYGYRRVKLEKQKGWTLEPDEHTPVVQDIFRWYTSGAEEEDGTLQRLGISRIVRRLNEHHIPAPGGKDWTDGAVPPILRNPAYAGWIRWGYRAQRKSVVDGEVVKSRPHAGEDSLKLTHGIHPALVSQGTFDLAQNLLAKNKGRPGPKNCETKNPLAGLVRCSRCGRTMVRRPYGNGRKDTLLCPYTSCQTVASDLDVVERLVIRSLKSWLADFESTPLEADSAAEAAERASLSRLAAEREKELQQIDEQEMKAYDLTEQGVYTPEIFTGRMAELSRRRQAALEQLQGIRASQAKLGAVIQAKREIAPAVRRVLDSYDLAKTAKEKNDLLRSVLDYIEYHKSIGGRYRDSDLFITISPKLPYKGASPTI